MKNASEWWKEWSGATRPVLILGDGPTLARLGEFDTTPYSKIALNPKAAPGPVDVLCLLNEGALQAGASAAQNAQFILVPTSLAARAKDAAPFKDFADTGRLITFDLPAPSDDVETRTDAGDILGLFATLGVKTARTLGVDYGFGPKPEVVRATDSIACVVPKFELCGPLTSEVPARVFVGTDATQMLGAAILEYSMRKHSTLTVVFDTMQHVVVPMPKDPKNQPRTHFSFHRFAIPKLAGYKGRALYVDADMLVFGDLRELWEMPFGDATVVHAPSNIPGRPKQTSVMLLDCDRLKWDVEQLIRDLDNGTYDYNAVMTDMKMEPEGAVQDKLPIVWNSLEEYAPGETRLIHYTHMETQPWVSRRNKNGYLWIQAVLEAMADGVVTLAEVEEAVKDGFIRPSLLWQLKTAPSYQGIIDTIGPLLDARYKPHRALNKRLKAAGI